MAESRWGGSCSPRRPDGGGDLRRPDGRTDLPPGTKREYSSYIGTYTFDGSRLVTRVDGASDPSRIGSDQVRGVRFDGERMVLSPPPRQTASGEQFRELTWEKIADE